MNKNRHGRSGIRRGTLVSPTPADPAARANREAERRIAVATEALGEILVIGDRSRAKDAKVCAGVANQALAVLGV